MSDAPLKKSSLLAYVLPGAPIAALGLPIVVYLPPFYAQDMGLGLGLVGTIFMIARFWDVITDPLMGVLSDRFPSRWGRRRHWIVLAVPILIACVYMVFMPPETFLGSPISGGYLLFWMLLLYIGYTLITISHLSWGAELHPDYHERSRIQGWREVAVVAGMVAALALPALIDRVAADGAAGMSRVAAMGWFIILAMPPAVLIAVSCVSERPQPKRPATKVPLSQTLRIIVTNKPLQKLVSADLLAGLATGATGSLFIFFVSHVIGLGHLASALLLLYFITGCVAAPIWIKISYRVGKHRALAIATMCRMVFAIMILFAPTGNMLAAAILFALFGSTYAAAPFLLRSIIADVADHDEAQSGVQRTGLYYSLLTLTNKIGHALAVGITYPLIEWIGFEATGMNSKETLNAFTAIFIGFPIICEIVLIAAIWNFPIDAASQAQTRMILEQRRQAALSEGAAD